MVVNVRPPSYNYMPTAYCCKACNGIRRKQSSVDEVVVDYMIEILSQPAVVDALASGDPERTASARSLKAGALARKKIASDRFATGQWDADRVDATDVIADKQIAEADAIIRESTPLEIPLEMVGPDAAANWAKASLEMRRALIRGLVTVTIKPTAVRGHVFDDSAIDVQKIKRRGDGHLAEVRP
jgi:hypothetical protein